MSRLAAVGCYTGVSGGPVGRGHGITLVDLAEDGTSIRVRSEVPIDSPSYLCWSGDGSTLFAVSETDPGAVAAFRLEHGALSRLATSDTRGGRPCHVVEHPSGRYVVVSSYAGGTFSAYDLTAGGSTRRA